jgi:hypothetical protein
VIRLKTYGPFADCTRQKCAAFGAGFPMAQKLNKNPQSFNRQVFGWC